MQIPSSTYRIQLHAGFTFRDLEAILDYLHELGISTVYASPITQSVKGSMHGYDGTDPLRVNREIGTEAELERLSGLLKKYNMNWLQDIVPNHMAYDSSNPWLSDVLERGKNSEYHRFFDIDWDHPDPALKNKLMAPFLGDDLDACLQRSEIRLDLMDQGLVIRYFDALYPVNPSSYVWIGSVFKECPPEWTKSAETLVQTIKAPLAEWQAKKKEWHRRITTDPAVRGCIDPLIAFFNGSPQLLEKLVRDQHYLLTHHRLAATKINYRRFFTVNSLICLRMEDEKVFRAYHENILSWYKKRFIQGLRIDHIDGLADPSCYAHRLKNSFGQDCYIIAEKILQADEPLPGDWRLEGATGYEFLFLVNQLMTEQEGSRKILEFYRQLVPATPRYEDIQFAKKYDYLKTHMAGELDNLTNRLIGDRLFPGIDSTPSAASATAMQADRIEPTNKEALKEALAVLMASFPVYRIYPDTGSLPETSRRIVAAAFSRARQKAPSSGPVLDALQQIIEGTGDEQKDRGSLSFRMRLMQFTGPLAAKGIEDTTFYTYDPLLSHNEVGDSPGINGIGIEEFHQKMSHRQASLPLSLNATGTHDTKRGEDARVRLNLLSAIPDEWIAAVNRWRKINHSLIKAVNGHAAPTPNDEYFIYQSLLGGLPSDMVITDVFRERFRAYLIKALREAKTETNWEQPDEGYEKSCLAFADALLAQQSPFLKEFIPFAGRIIQKASIYSLSQLLIKLTAPGIPDIYQGAELWDLSFVDPDNRRPVNYDHRKYLLKELADKERRGIPALLTFLTANKGKGVEKLFVIQKTLAYRQRHPLVFTQGEYLPLRTDPNWIAYVRKHEKDWLLVIVPLIRKEWDNVKTMGLLSLDLPADAPGQWKNEFTGQLFTEGTNSMSAEIFAGFPVTLLSGTGA